MSVDSGELPTPTLSIIRRTKVPVEDLSQRIVGLKPIQRFTIFSISVVPVVITVLEQFLSTSLSRVWLELCCHEYKDFSQKGFKVGKSEKRIFFLQVN